MTIAAVLLIICGGVELGTPTARAWLYNNQLLDAARSGDERALQAAIDKGADVDHEFTAARVTALSTAAHYGHAGVVTRLIAANAKLDEYDVQNYLTALHYASKSGHVQVVRLLLDAGASADLLSATYYSPLMLACTSVHVDVVRLLLAANATVDLQTHLNNTALFFAAYPSEGRPQGARAQAAQVDVVHLLLEAGADVHHRDKDGKTILHRLEEHTEEHGKKGLESILELLQAYQDGYSTGLPKFAPLSWEVERERAIAREHQRDSSAGKRRSPADPASRLSMVLAATLVIGSSATIGLLEWLLRRFVTRRRRPVWIWPGCLLLLAFDALHTPYPDSQQQWQVQSVMLADSARTAFWVALLSQLLPTNGWHFTAALFYFGDYLIVGQLSDRIFYAGAVLSAAGLFAALWPSLASFLGPPKLLVGLSAMRVLAAAAGIIGAINEGRTERSEPELVPSMPSYWYLRVPVALLFAHMSHPVW